MQGIRLTRHHAFKVCSPSRASFHTGRMAYSMGLCKPPPPPTTFVLSHLPRLEVLEHFPGVLNQRETKK